MGRHAETHRNGNAVKVYRVKNSTSDFRPEEHTWNSHLREYFPGSDTILTNVEPPNDMLVQEASQIECRKCRKKRAEWPKHASAHTKSAMLSKLVEHEKFCAGRA